MSAYPNSDLNPVLAAGNSKVSVISDGKFREESLQSLKNIDSHQTSLIFFSPDKQAVLSESTRRKT